MIARTLSAAALMAALTLSAAAEPAARTGTGGGAESTIYAPNTSSVGRTMPPAGGGGVRREPESRDRETTMEKKNDKIDTGICIGCN